VSNIDKDLRKKLRAMWIPRRKEMPEQCTSCPFRTGNDAEFGDVIKRMCAASGEPMTKTTALRARFMLKMETEQAGDFICHQSAYDKDMNLRDASENRQCPGATKHYRDGGV